MNSNNRYQYLAGITLTEEKEYNLGKKYASHDKASLEAKKKELQAVKINSARASFKYKNAVEEIAAIDAALKLQDEKAVKEAAELEAAALLEKKDDSDKKDDDKEDKKSDKDDDKEEKDDKPAFLKDKKDDDKDSDKKDDDKSDKDDDKDSDKDEKKEKKDDKKESKDDDSDKKDDDKDDKTEVKVEIKVEETAEESAADIAKRLMEKDLTPTEVKVDYQNGPEENYGNLTTAIHVPAAVRKEVTGRIKELKAAILRYDDKGYNDKSIKQQAVDCLEQILQDLSTNDVEGVKKAQIYFETLMSPLTDFFPPKLVNWLANALNPYVGVKESLRPRVSPQEVEDARFKYNASEWSEEQRGANILEQLRSGKVRPGSPEEKHLAISLAKYGDVEAMTAAIKEGLSPAFGHLWVRQLLNYGKDGLVEQLFADGVLKPYEAKLRELSPQSFADYEAARDENRSFTA